MTVTMQQRQIGIPAVEGKLILVIDDYHLISSLEIHQAILLGVITRKVAFWLMPLVLFTGTAVATITPSAVMPGIVRLAHFIELGFSMIVVGLFMVWFFVRDKAPQGENQCAKNSAWPSLGCGFWQRHLVCSSI